MTKKVYTLSTCDTSKRILKECGITNKDFEIIDIKKDGFGKQDIEDMHRLSGSYEALFSKRAQLYKSRGLKDKKLSEDDFKELLLEHYTFLKRPVVIIGKRIFIGNTKKNITALAEAVKAATKEKDPT